MTDHLSLPLRLPHDDHQRYERLAALTRSVATHVLNDHWQPAHLDGIQTFSYQAWKYFDEHEAFAALDLYLPSRIRRCILQKVGETLRSQADRRTAFHSIQHVLPEHKVRRIHRRRIKHQLWDDSEYLTSGYVDILIDQLNSYYDRHGHFPETYFEMQDCPEYSSGVLPYSADDGPTSGQAVKYSYDTDSTTLTVQLKTPDTLTPETRGEWTWTEHELNSYDAFAELLAHGNLSAPEFQPTRRKTGVLYYELSVPVEVDQGEPSDGMECVLALDAGMRTDMTAVVVTEAGEQLSQPHFIRFTDRGKMRRLHRERQRLNERLAALRRAGRAHTDVFAHMQSEYEGVNAKIQHKREQLVHDVANQVLALALVYEVDAIVHEDLRSLRLPRGEGTLSWELSSWARREIIEKIEYRAECTGVGVEQVHPTGTSRSCPRCGATGHTCKSPDHHEEVWWGGHFRCDNSRCDFEGDRDYVGAVNVARVFFNDGPKLDHSFTVSYTGTSETVLARRSAGTRLTFGHGIVVYTPEQPRVTVGGGSAVIAPAVTLPESNAAGSDGRGPTVHQCHRFQRVTTESY
jgi:putative transposase